MGGTLPAAAGREEAPPAPVGGLALLAVYAGGQIGSLLVVDMLLLAHPPALAAARAMLLVRLSYLVSPAVLLAAGLIGLRAVRFSPPARLARWPGVGAILAGAAAGLVLKIVGDVVAFGEAALSGPITGNNPLSLYPHAFPGAASRVLLVVSVGFVAPAAEELFFRGLLFGWLRGGLGRWPAVVLGGALFGLAHVDPVSIRDLLQTLPLALPLGCVGAGLCLLYERYRTLWVPAAAHAAVNLSALVLTFWT